MQTEFCVHSTGGVAGLNMSQHVADVYYRLKLEETETKMFLTLENSPFKTTNINQQKLYTEGVHFFRKCKREQLTLAPAIFFFPSFTGCVSLCYGSGEKLGAAGSDNSSAVIFASFILLLVTIDCI